MYICNMKKLIIGSEALKHWFPEDYPREPKDLDIVVESTEGLTNTEIELTPEEVAEGQRLQTVKKQYWESIQDEIGELQWSKRQHNDSFKKYQAMPSEWDYKRDCITNKLGLGKVVEVEQYGGEDQGSTWYSVKHFVDHDVYIRTDGYYQSYNGTDFHDGHGHVVTPQKKTITVFE